MSPQAVSLFSSTVSSRPHPGVAPPSPRSSAPPRCLPGDWWPCPGCAGLRQGLPCGSRSTQGHRSAPALSTAPCLTSALNDSPPQGSDPCISSPRPRRVLHGSANSFLFQGLLPALSGCSARASASGETIPGASTKRWAPRPPTPLLSASSSLFSSVQSLSRVRLFAIPWTAARQASLSITNSQSSLKLMFIESAMPSNHLIFLSPSPPSFSLSQHQGLFK